MLGGDGTVGWVLSCIDTLQSEAASERSSPDKGAGKEATVSEHWTPPPVAVLPLGTGKTACSAPAPSEVHEHMASCEGAEMTLKIRVSVGGLTMSSLLCGSKACRHRHELLQWVRELR